MLDSYLQAQCSIINSVRDWFLPMRWVSNWACYWLSILAASALLFSAHLVGRTYFGLMSEAIKERLKEHASKFSGDVPPI